MPSMTSLPTPGGPTMWTGLPSNSVPRLSSLITASIPGMPKQWSPWRCVTQMRCMPLGSKPGPRRPSLRPPRGQTAALGIERRLAQGEGAHRGSLTLDVSHLSWRWEPSPQSMSHMPAPSMRTMQQDTLRERVGEPLLVPSHVRSMPVCRFLCLHQTSKETIR